MFGLITLWQTVKTGVVRAEWSSVAQITLTVQHAAITPLMGLRERIKRSVLLLCDIL